MVLLSLSFEICDEHNPANIVDFVDEVNGFVSIYDNYFLNVLLFTWFFTSCILQIYHDLRVKSDLDMIIKKLQMIIIIHGVLSCER